ncbi:MULTISPECIES: LysR family transcriptional regulator [Lysobacter]|jgi:DNA-binding transcriptional LysR family regulator|uniref:LysR substrate-binding domain-containing protein n=1 Tax=Lysobacter gummosus TaxID=262324 RepID=A0ABY3XJ99_9GAMM|nr:MULTISPECIES: LysR family transcriptional regulator [Lysobacter]ALN91311.1 bacterial regulatory helix-turn-helix, lysR family protein [Lysobacter gummosus]MBT2745346.1 LysR family transcriptional regulator [Lysobacter sp. ISL-42]MBT2751943.1 LysR family transcriptional regulator [Lysobacter sp. ISL-50]MBT2777908.1 LysR family transcriptional regulator [Lysobacter sp. ISL-54]MBT2783164.1 LysR family transcriptional regulator [Lysobacter sp. ISL-52]
MSINCEILDLRAFLTVSETRSFHRAAEALHVSQPALSRRIQKLEEAVGAPLLERTTRSVSLTAVGQNLLPLVRRMLEEFDGSLFAARGIDDGRGSQVTIACLPTAAFYFLPSVIARFHEEHPNVRFRILDLSATEGLQAVERGEVEFGINFMGASDPELNFDVLVEDPFVLACRRDHPLALKRKVTWNDLSSHRLITVHRTSGNRILLDGALARENLKLSWFFEVTHLSTSLGMVEAGVGISVLPRMATPQQEHPILVTRPLQHPVVSRTIGIVRRRNAVLSAAAEQFLQMLKTTWQGRAK